MQQQNALRNVLGGQNFNLMSPQGVRAVAPLDPASAIRCPMLYAINRI